MTADELEKIVDAIRTGYQLRSESIAGHVKLLRSIELAALREAREIVEKSAIIVRGAEPLDNPALPELDKRIRDLELR